MPGGDDRALSALVREAAERVRIDAGIQSDLRAIAACGPRFCGTASEQQAVNFLADRLGEFPAGAFWREIFLHQAWSCAQCSLQETGEGDAHFALQPFINAAPTVDEGLVARIIDLGRGTEAEIRAQADVLRGAIAMVSHEYMFSSSRIRPSLKYQWAREAGAAAVLVCNQVAGDLPVSGTVGTADRARIPAAGISRETAERLKQRAAEGGEVRLILRASRSSRPAENLHREWPGQSDKLVVLSAHIDGHDLGTGAMDNAAGLAIVLSVARAIEPLLQHCQAGLRISLFNAEEWDMQGSEAHVAAMSPDQRRRILLNVNVDAPASGAQLTAFTTGSAPLTDFIRRADAAWDLGLAVHEPPLWNSDHASFARIGIPAVRFATGWEDPASDHRFMLTQADTLDKVDHRALQRAARVAAVTTLAACALGDLSCAMP